MYSYAYESALPSPVPAHSASAENYPPRCSASQSFAAIKDVLEKGSVILPLDYYSTSGKKQMTGMMAAPILIGDDSFICVVVVIFNLSEKRLYLHETFLTEKIPEIAASSLVRGSDTASPQSQGSIAKILSELLISK